MPAARSSSSKSRKSKASNLHSTSKPPSKPRPNGAKRVACRAWWCDSTYTRRADMLKHVSLEHFGKRIYCTACRSVMKQKSNMDTHLNAHFANYCTLCSCGQGFTDPSVCTRHRNTTGHDTGVTFGKVRPSIMEGVKVQHLAGLSLTLEMISDPSFVPPSFDESYHLKGMPKPKGQEKYNPTDYLIIEPVGAPAIPNTQATGISLTEEAPAAKYQEPTTVEHPAPAETEIQVDKLGINVNFSYDVELPQDPQYGQLTTADVHTECHGPAATYPTHHSQPPSDGHYTPPEAISPYSSYPTTVPCVPTDANMYPHQYLENYSMAINNYHPPAPQPFFEPRVRPEYLDTLYPSRAPNPPSWSMPPPSLNMPPHHNYFEEMGFGVRVTERFQHPQYQQQQPQPFYHPNANFYNHAYQPALATY